MDSLCCEDGPHDRYAPTPIAGAAWPKGHDCRATRRRDEEDILKYRKPTCNLMWFYRSNRSCVHPREKGNKLY